MKPRSQIFLEIPSSPVTGSIVVTPSGGTPPTSLSLSGSGAGWSASGTTLTLRPMHAQALTVWYELTFSCASGFTLFGLQIFKEDQRSTIFFPASSGNVTLNLLTHIGPNESAFQYSLEIGVQSGSTIHWFDPTIAFEPQVIEPPAP